MVMLEWRKVLLPLVLITAAAVLAYANSFRVPFLLDDSTALAENPQFAPSAPLSSALRPAENTGLGGRPVASLAFALNLALGGRSLVSLHVGNLLVHLAAAALVFGIVRRTLPEDPSCRAQKDRSLWIGTAVAVVWVVLPLNTEAVTYLSQRTESLMGLLYLATLYSAIRGFAGHGYWHVAAVVCCALGMGTKEGMVTAPITVLVYDTVFVSRSWRTALRSHLPLYLGLAATWAILPALMGGLGGRGVGFGHGMSPLHYAFLECGAILRYIHLALWPNRLVFDYGADIAMSRLTCVFGGVLLATLVVATVIGLRRRSPWSFVGAWFLLTLAPTSSIVPIPLQPVAENRPYIATLAIVTVVAILLRATLRRTIATTAVVTIAVAFGALTLARNSAYRSELSIWTDTVTKNPGSSRAHKALADALLDLGRLPEAKEHYDAAVRIDPKYAGARVNLARLYGTMGQHERARAESQRATELEPGLADAHSNLGVALVYLGRFGEAVEELKRAVELQPSHANATEWLATALYRANRPAEALPIAARALELNPQRVEIRNTIALCLERTGRRAEALELWRQIVAAAPANSEAQYSYGTMLLQHGDAVGAIAALEAATRLNPRFAPAHSNLGIALWQCGRKEAAIAQVELAVQLDPAYVDAQKNLAAMRGASKPPTPAP